MPQIDLVIEDGDFIKHNNKIYRISVASNSLVFSKLSANNNIKEYYATVDAL